MPKAIINKISNLDENYQVDSPTDYQKIKAKWFSAAAIVYEFLPHDAKTDKGLMSSNIRR